MKPVLFSQHPASQLFGAPRKFRKYVLDIFINAFPAFLQVIRGKMDEEYLNLLMSEDICKIFQLYHF